jgi:hypothetical protein
VEESIVSFIFVDWIFATFASKHLLQSDPMQSVWIVSFLVSLNYKNAMLFDEIKNFRPYTAARSVVILMVACHTCRLMQPAKTLPCAPLENFKLWEFMSPEV